MTDRFFIYSLLEQKIKNSVKEMEEILNHVDDNSTEIILRSVFSYGVSHFENILMLIIKEIYTAYPDRVASKEFKMSKEQIISEKDILEMFIDNSINNIAYKDLDTFLKKYSEITRTPIISEEIVDRLIEIKETRNLIIHNNLKVNTIYLSKCADNTFCRADENDLGKSLKLDKKYVYDSLEFCKNVIAETLLPNLNKEYRTMTQEKAMETVWNRLFNSSILKFEDYWEFDDNGNIDSCLQTKIKRSFSTTEQLLFAKIMIHYTGYASYEEGDDQEVNSYPYNVFPASKFNVNTMYGDRYEIYLYLEKSLRNTPQLFNKDF